MRASENVFISYGHMSNKTKVHALYLDEGMPISPASN
jgi:hypothetical protein